MQKSLSTNINTSQINIQDILPEINKKEISKEMKKNQKKLETRALKQILTKEKKQNQKKISNNKEEKIFTIQKYQNSKRFSDYIKKNINIKYTSQQLQKLSENDLENILQKIRINLDNKNMDAIYNNMAKTMANGLEMSVSPFYDIYGFSDRLLDNEQFLDCYEKLKIEYKLPTMPPTLQLFYIISSTMMIQHNLNKMKNVNPIPEMEPPKIDINKLENDTSKKKKKTKIKIVKSVKDGDII